jgi:hypothetical protein
MRQFILFILLWLGITACADHDILTIKGKIFLKGSEPHTYIVIEEKDTHHTYKITNQKKFDLLHKQKESITIQAKHIKKAIGPGFPDEIEVLSVIK